ncbi:hypothetical protein [Streptomyces smyrnaeus]|uniref:hypothetical protein n=1 Tax=Streptomyces smyrnaeus TaxID=1387713 RepID=UPI0033C127EC
MPKQSTAAQAARNDARAGMKYTEALRARKSGLAVPAAPHIVQFLAERSGNFYQLVGGITAVWARSGHRVLLLQEASDAWRWVMRPRGRNRRKQAPAVPPEPRTTVLWTPPTGASGCLVHHICMWEALGPRPQRGFPDIDRSQLHAALDAAGTDYDVIVMLPEGSWSYPDTDAATAHVILADIDDFPHTDCRSALPGSLEETGAALSPEQSAAVLRDRCRSFLFNIHRREIPLKGVIWQTHRKPPVDAAYLARIDRDMDRAGLPSLGWNTFKGWPTSYRQLPDPEELQDPDLAHHYEHLARRVHAALDTRPASQPTARHRCAPATITPTGG